jgi:hypothetical protein
MEKDQHQQPGGAASADVYGAKAAQDIAKQTPPAGLEATRKKVQLDKTRRRMDPSPQLVGWRFPVKDNQKNCASRSSILVRPFSFGSLAVFRAGGWFATPGTAAVTR